MTDFSEPAATDAERSEGLAPAEPATDAVGYEPAMHDAKRWQIGWALAALACGAALLAVSGALSLPELVAFAAAAAPALLGAFWRPAGCDRYDCLGLFGVGVLLAAVVTGGVSGPLASWCAAPLLLGLLSGAARKGAVVSAAALILTALAELFDVAPSAETGSRSAVLSGLALVLLIGAMSGAALALMRRLQRQPALLEPERGPPQDMTAEAALSVASVEPDAGPVAMEPVEPPVVEPGPAPEAVQVTDDTALAQAREAVAAAEAERDEALASAAAKSRFLANMSHELRTPLNAIMGFSDIMRARMFGELSPKYGEYAELIHESGRHLTDLINDVLDMSKIEADRYTLHIERFDARDAVNAALRLTRLQADEAGIQLRGLLPGEPLAVQADRRAIKQIVLNLVSNALKFTPREGAVTLTLMARGPDMEIVVADTGAGIAPEDLERLGRPYEQAGDAKHRVQGTGLGLSLVKALAGLHGGAMSIESALGEGTAVTVRLPVIEGGASTGPSAEIIPLTGRTGS